jgi:hypothetical protein
MKKIFLLLSLVAVFFIAFAQNANHSASFDGLDEFKIGMSKAELEKILGKKIVLKHIMVDEIYTETIDVSYKGADFQLYLMRSQIPAEVARLESVSTKSPAFKTPEGIGIGSDQSKIIDSYEKHLLIITKESITLVDINNIHSSIVFYLKDKKVTEISVELTALFRDTEGG